MTAGLGEAGRGRIATLFTPLASEQALALLTSALAGADPCPVAAPVNPAALRSLDLLTAPALLRALLPRDTPAAPAGSRTPLGEQLAGQTAEQRHVILLDLVRSHTAAVLGHAGPEVVHPEHNFKDLGLDSLTAVELRNRLSSATRLRLPATMIFERPTPDAMALRIGELMAPAAEEPAPGAGPELARLEAFLTAGSTDPEARDSTLTGLRDLLRRFGADSLEADRDLVSATNEELFEALDQELEMPNHGSMR
jgi:polyketide synthase 12